MRFLVYFCLLSFIPGRAQFTWNEGELFISAPLQTCKGEVQIYVAPLLLTGYSLSLSFKGDSIMDIDTVGPMKTCFSEPEADTAFWMNADNDSAKELVVVLFATPATCDCAGFYFRVLVFDDEENFCAGRPFVHRHELDFEYQARDLRGSNPFIIAEIRRRQKMK